MESILDSFEDLPSVVERIDILVSEATKTRGKKEKKALLSEAQTLADAYQDHCERGGNDKKQFNPFI
jgi:hypothetical protein